MSKSPDKNILVTVCAFLCNSEMVVTDYVAEVTSVLEEAYEYYEVLLIDNGSSDKTVHTVRELLGRYRNVRLIVLARQYDEQIAYTVALENCIGDYVVVMDLLTDPTEAIPGMVGKSVGGADIVTGIVAEKTNETLGYRFLSHLFYRLINLLTDSHLDISWSNYVCLSRKMVNALLQVKDRVRYFKYLQNDIGYRRDSVVIEQFNRLGIRKKHVYWNRFFFALDALSAYSEKLIRIASMSSLGMCILSFFYVFYALGIKLLKSHVAEGWTSISIVLAVMFGVLFFILFIVSEYLYLVYCETRKGALYHVADEANSSVLFGGIIEKNVDQY